MGQIVEGSYWLYAPVKGASIVFAVLFTISGVLHIWQNNLKYHSWRIGFLLPWAALLFVAGFCLREYGAYHFGDLNIFIASNVLLFCAPPVYAGADYFILGRILYYIPYLSPLHPGRVWTTFITLDTIVEILSGNGASHALNREDTPLARKIGLDLIKASLLLQIALFLCFVLIIVIFHRRCVREGVFTRNTKVIIYQLYASSCLILIRNTFRTATFFYPYNSTANDTEWIFWVLEALPMLANTYLMNVYPPAKYFPKNNRIYLAKDGHTELEGPGIVDKRHFFLTILDPFDIAGIVSGKDSRNRFWEEDGIGGPRKERNEVTTD